MASTAEKIVFILTQCYDTPSGKVRKIFLGILSVELDGVRARKWNAERVIIFQFVILQRAQGVNNSAQIRKRVLLLLHLWNLGAFDELVKDMYNSAIGYLRKISWDSNYGGTSSNVFEPCPEEKVVRSHTISL